MNPFNICFFNVLLIYGLLGERNRCKNQVALKEILTAMAIVWMIWSERNNRLFLNFWWVLSGNRGCSDVLNFFGNITGWGSQLESSHAFSQNIK